MMKIKNLVLTTLLSLGMLTSCANNDNQKDTKEETKLEESQK